MPKGIFIHKPLTELHKKHLSEVHKGIKFSEERKARMSKSRIGKKRPPFSEEWKRKLGLANKGKKRTIEQIEKFRKARMGHFTSKETKDKISKSHIGMKHTAETIKKLSGENNHFWKGGITPLRKIIRTNFKYRQWISDVFTKDSYTCQECFARGGKLSAHHLKSFSIILEENKIKTLDEALDCEELWNINNGQTLCFSCHKKTPNYARNLPKLLKV